MNRRALLQVCGTTLCGTVSAGCLGNDAADADDTPDTPDADWVEAPDLGDVNARAPDPLTATASVLNHGTFTRPPMVTVTLGVTDGQAHLVGPFSGDGGPFAGVILAGDGHDERLRLGESHAVESINGCWQWAGNDEPAYVRVAPDTDAAVDLEIVPAATGNPTDRPGCFLTGTYRATPTVGVYDADAAPTNDAPEERTDEVVPTLEVTLL